MGSHNSRYESSSGYTEAFSSGEPGSNEVFIYINCNYDGFGRVSVGNYPNIPNPIGNRQMSSIKVPVGLSVLLYEQPNYGGNMWKIDGPQDISCFVGGGSPNGWWNDKPQSMKIMSTTPPSSASNMVGNCTINTNYDYPYNDITNGPSSSLADCANQCEQNPQCNAFARANSNGWCWLKTKLANQTPNTDRTCGTCTRPCGKQVTVNIPYNVGSKTLENCKEYTMDSSTHTVDFKISNTNAVTVINATPLCGRTEKYILDHDLGTQQLQRCQTYNLTSPTGSVTVTIGSDGTVKYTNIQSFGTQIDNTKRQLYLNTRYFFITSPYYNRQISGRNDNSVTVIQNRLGWEQWTMVAGQNNQVYFQNNTFTGQYLACMTNGTIKMINQKTPESSWVLIKTIGQYTTATDQVIIRSVAYPFVLSTDSQLLNNMPSTPKGVTFDPSQFDKMVWDIAPYDQLRLVWSNKGPVGGLQALQITNPSTATTLGNTWGQTYLCYTHEIGLVWCTNDNDKNKLVALGYKATQIAEGAEPPANQWMNKWLCLPAQSYVSLAWTSSDAGRDQLISQGYQIVKWAVPGDPYTWADNYLGYKWIKRTYDTQQSLPYILSLQAGGFNSGWCKSQPQTGQFFQAIVNYKSIMSRKGTPLVQSGRGLNLCTFDQNLLPLKTASYDTYAVPQDSDNFINDATKSINDTNVRLIIIGSTDEPTNSLKNTVRVFMATQLGANYFSYLEFRGSYLLVYDNSAKNVVYEAMNNCEMVTFNSQCSIYCTPIFNAEWYVNYYPDLLKAFGDPKLASTQQKARDHWKSNGSNLEGRQASPTFAVQDYIQLYPDVQQLATNNNFLAAIQHYLTIGFQQNRIGIIFKSTHNKYGLLSNYLQCYLDSRQTDSYSGSGTTWKDISGNNRNFNWNTAPQYDDGSFKYTQTSVATGPPSNSFGLAQATQGYTIVMVVKQRVSNSSTPFTFYGQNNQVGIGATMNGAAQSMSLTHMQNNNQTIYMGGTTWNQTCFWTYVKTASGQLQIYCSGNLQNVTSSSGNVANSPLDLSSTPCAINYNKNWNGDISVFAVYNFGLLPTNIKDIYNWWVQSEITRKGARDIDMSNKTKTAIQSFPVPLGLQCYIDANYATSYSGKGLVWNDLSPYKRNFTFQSQPVFNSNYISTTGNNKLTGPASNSFNIDEDGNYTIVWYAKTNSLSQDSVFQFYGTNANADRGIFCHPTWTDQTMYWDQMGCCSADVRLTTPVQGYWNKFTVYAIVRDEKGRHMYINGAQVSTTADRGHLLNLATRPLDILVTESYPTWNCNFGAFMVFNRGLVAQNVLDIYNWLVSPYEFQQYSWDQASQYCINQGQQLCTYQEYCPNGAMQSPVYKLPPGDMWAPVVDSTNQWVELGNPTKMCQLHTSVCKGPNNYCGSDNKPLWGTKPNSGRRAILCCNPPKIQVYFDTIGQISEDTCLMFKNKTYIKYNIKNHVSSDLMNIDSLNLSGIFKDGKFQACLDYQSQNLIYIFKDSLLIQFNYLTNAVTRPVAINTVYPGLPLSYQKGEFDAVLRLSQSQFAIFRGRQVVVYDEVNHSSVDPVDINVYWTGLRSIFTSGQITAFIQMSPNQVAVFKEDLYMIYTGTKMNGPYNIVPIWRGLKIPFIRESEECLIYNAQLNYLTSSKANMAKTGNTEQLNEIDKHINIYNILLSKSCNFISYSDYLKDLEAKKAQMNIIKQKITDSLASISQKQAQIVNVNKEIKKINQQISDVIVLIDIENRKVCPIDATCQVTKSQSNPTDNRPCTDAMLISLLKNGRISPDQMQKIQVYLDYKPGISNFPIETHPDFYKYSKIKEINNNCSSIKLEEDAVSKKVKIPDYIKQLNNKATTKTGQNLNANPNANTNTTGQKSNSNTTGQKPNLNTDTDTHTKTLNIFKKAMAKHQETTMNTQISQDKSLNPWIQKSQSEANRLGINATQDQLKLCATSLQLIENLKKSKKLSYETEQIMNYIINNNRYRHILSEIYELKNYLTTKKNQLNQQNQMNLQQQPDFLKDVNVIIAKNKSLANEINAVEQLLSEKITLVDQFHQSSW